MGDSSVGRGLETVLVGTDFSPGTGLALERALHLPLAPGATVHVVHVLPEQLPARVRPSVMADAKAALAKQAATLEQVARAKGASDVSIAWEIAQGRQPHVELIRAARQRRAELIVMGRHGEHSLRERLMGSTTERLVRHSDTPSLIVTSERPPPYRVPIVAIDLAEEVPVHQGLVDLTLRLVAPYPDGLTLLHAFEVPFEGRLRPVLATEDLVEYRKEYRRKAVQDFSRLRGELQIPDVAVKMILASGDPRQALVREVKRRGADLLVLGTHGRTGVAHALLGSVAEWTIGRAPCDIAVQRPREFRFEAP